MKVYLQQRVNGLQFFFMVLILAFALISACSSDNDTTKQPSTSHQPAQEEGNAMSGNASNWCYVSEPTAFYLESKYLVLIDPLVLDGLADKLVDLPEHQSADPKESIAPLSSPNYPMRIGVHEIENFQPGNYQLGPNDFISIDHDKPDSEVVDVDSGTIIAVDFAHLASLVTCPISLYHLRN